MQKFEFCNIGLNCCIYNIIICITSIACKTISCITYKLQLLYIMEILIVFFFMYSNVCNSQWLCVRVSTSMYCLVSDLFYIIHIIMKTSSLGIWRVLGALKRCERVIQRCIVTYFRSFPITPLLTPSTSLSAALPGNITSIFCYINII